MAELKIAENGKFTEKDMFNYLKEEFQEKNEHVVEWCEKKLVQLEKRANSPRKPQFNAEANEFALKVFDVLSAAGEPMTNKELTEAMTDKLGYKVTAQKTAAALKRLADHKVIDGDNANDPTLDCKLVIEEEGKAKTFAIR